MEKAGKIVLNQGERAEWLVELVIFVRGSKSF